MLYDELVQPGEYICHYGVKGQKWGVRHEENKKANILGRAATSLRWANKHSQDWLNSAQKKYDKKPTPKNKKALDIAKEVNKRISKDAKISLKDLNKHYNELVKKYGQDSVKDIRYDKQGNINDYSRAQVVLGGAASWATAALMAVAMSGFTGSVGVGIGVNPYPSPYNVGRQIYMQTYRQVAKEMKNN